MSDKEGGVPKVAESKGGREPLVQRRTATTRRVEAVFRAMSTDFLLREQFVTDPAQVLSEYLRGTRLTAEKASVTNQLLYSVMSNRKLLVWLRDYSVKHRGRPPSRQKILGDFGRAVVEHGSHHVVLALIRSSVEQEAVLGFFDEALVQILFEDGGIFADKDGTGGEEGMGPGTGVTTQDDGTTESTPGTDDGTEQSTGTSTEKSGSGFFGTKYILTLNALVQYSTHLRDAGGLDVAVGE